MTQIELQSVFGAITPAGEPQFDLARVSAFADILPTPPEAAPPVARLQ